MDVTLRPELQRFINDQVKTGRFSSASEALEAGVARLMLDPQPDVLDARDLADLRTALDQLKHDETLDAADVHQRLQKKYLG
jgi:putative addiction module CopG family antidote